MVYCVGPQNFFSIKKKHLSKHSCCKIFSKSFKNLKNNKKKYLDIAKNKLASRFAGEFDEKLLLDQKTETVLFKKNLYKKKIIENKKKTNILVAAHCFSDAVHAYGKFFYTDYHDWIKFIGELSKIKLNFDFYIKIHPAEYDKNYFHFIKFQKIFPNLKILPKEININQLFTENFDLVLTIYGSVGHEYPLFNKLIINASNNGPHSSYDFNVNPKNKKEYESIIKNISKNRIKMRSNFNKNKIYEFYFMRYLSEYSLLDNWTKVMKQLKNKYNSFDILSHFINNFDLKSHNQKLKDINLFITENPIRLVADNTSGISNIIGKIK